MPVKLLSRGRLLHSLTIPLIKLNLNKSFLERLVKKFYLGLLGFNYFQILRSYQINHQVLTAFLQAFVADFQFMDFNGWFIGDNICLIIIDGLLIAV